MLRLQTPVIDRKCNAGISYSDKILLLGSCFTDNIGKALKDYGFDVCVNPFGTLYNPASIAGAIRRLHSRIHFTQEDCVQMGSGLELFCSFFHHTSFARSTKEEFLENANSAIEATGEFFMECNKVIITLGTAWYFRHKGFAAESRARIGTESNAGSKMENNAESGIIVANCLKRNAGEFSRELLSVSEAEAQLGMAAGICGLPYNTGTDWNIPCGSRPKHIIFTVSPIRHPADGAHGNQISKSTLLLAVDNLISRITGQAGPLADYFPAYEIMMDELRDYRFYAEDMVHPSQQATGYILERFLNWALPAGERSRLEENIREFRKSQHRPKMQ